jgi:hypothetical protein
LFVANYMPRELARIIEFLNQQMSPAQVLGIELRQFAKGDVRTIVPRVIGRTIASATRKSARATKKWDEESFMEELGLRAGPEAVDTVRAVLDAFAGKVTRFWYGEGAKSGSVVPTLDTSLGFNPLFAIYTYGRFEIYFQHLKSRQPFTDIAKRKHLKDELNRIDGIVISDDQLDKRPSFDVTVLAAHDALARFRDAYFWVIKELRRVAGS